MKRPIPNERELTDLIARAFELTPEPDARRLAAIEERLLDRAGSRGRPKLAWWWLGAMLAAGAASALWWAVDYDSADGPGAPPPAVTSPAPQPPARPVPPADRESGSGAAPAPKQAPFIYRK